MADTDVVIRPPTAPERRRCESLIREAFWDVYRPGCIEHLIWRRAIWRGTPMRFLTWFLSRTGAVIFSDAR